MTTARKDLGNTLSPYLATVKVGLKGMDEGQQQEILAEIQSHLTDRIEQMTLQGSISPLEEALAAMGDPHQLSEEFVSEQSAVQASRSYFPWVLLRAASHLVLTGVRGAFVFVAGLIGFAATFAFMLAAIAKLIIPARIGFWVGPNTSVVWGYPGTTVGAHELAGPAFAYISIILAFLFGSGTTLLLKHMLRFSWTATKVLPSTPGLSLKRVG